MPALAQGGSEPPTFPTVSDPNVSPIQPSVAYDAAEAICEGQHHARRERRPADKSSRPAGTRLDELWRILPEESAANASGVLTIGGVAVDELAAEYGTLLHIYDEAGLRRQARRFVTGLVRRWPNSQVLFASKSLPAVAMYRLAVEEGLAIDVAGGGEFRLALAANVDPAMVYFHGNAKTDAELTHALDAGWAPSSSTTKTSWTAWNDYCVGRKR